MLIRRQNIRSLIVAEALFIVLLAGCNQASLMQKMTPQADAEAARNYVTLLRQSNFDQIEKDLDPSLKEADVRDTLATMAAKFPAGTPSSIKVVGANVFRGADAYRTSITLEYEFPRKWLLANVARQTRDGVTTVTRFQVTPIPDSLENLNRFTLAGKSWVQYTVLLLGALAVVLSLYAFVLCLRTRMGKTKWLWAVICLLGGGRLGMNWTTGQSDFTLLSIHLPPAGATTPLYGAWVVYVSLPLGAVLFLVLRDRLRRSEPSSDQSR